MAVQHQLSMQNAPQILLHPAQRSPLAAGPVLNNSTPISLHSIAATSISSATFLEPPQYLTAISVQPVLTSPAAFVPTSAAVISPVNPSAEAGMKLTAAQTHVHDQLQMKHEQLQQMIIQQQEELRLVSEQLLMTRYGIIPPIVNVCYPATSTAQLVPSTPRHGELEAMSQGEISNDGLHGIVQMQQQTSISRGTISQPHHQQQQAQHQQLHHQQPGIIVTHPQQQQHVGIHNRDVHFMDANEVVQMEQLNCGGGRNSGIVNSVGNSSEMLRYGMELSSMETEGHGQPQQAMVSGLEMIPYQLAPQQAHELFGSNVPTNPMNDNQGEE